MGKGAEMESPDDPGAARVVLDRCVWVARELDRVRPDGRLPALRALNELCCERPDTFGRLARPPAAAMAPAYNPADELALFDGALFGRDALRVADILWPRRVDLTEAAVAALAPLQGRRHHLLSEEEPGRIPHEVRSHPNSVATGPGQAGTYYGSIDATPMFCLAIARLGLRHPEWLDVELNDGPQPRTAAEHLGGAARWMLRRLDSSPLGLLESQPAHDDSIVNQSWKDSGDSHSHADGVLARAGTVASVDVQGIVYDALLAVAELVDAAAQAQERSPLAFPGAEEMRRRAHHVREVVLERCWLRDDDGAYFALGLDRDSDDNPRALAVRASNMGHLLDSRLLDGPELAAHREAIVRALFSQDLLCEAGIRTLAASEIRFWAESYHNGSVWPWDTYVIARGLHRHGFHGLGWDLMRRVWNVCEAHRCFPEFTAGTDRLEAEPSHRTLDFVDRDGSLLRLQQPPQQIQAWTVAAALAVKHAHGDVALRRVGALPARAVEPRVAQLEREILAEAALSR